MTDPIDHKRYVQFIFSYEFNGSKWDGTVWATTREEAEMKIRAMAGGQIIGSQVKNVSECPHCGETIIKD